VQNIVLEIKQYQREWLQHVQRTDTNRIPKQALKYRPNGKRNMGLPRKRWKDRLHLEGSRTGTTPDTSQLMVIMMISASEVIRNSITQQGVDRRDILIRRRCPELEVQDNLASRLTGRAMAQSVLAGSTIGLSV
jgi:hypothetical protein